MNLQLVCLWFLALLFTSTSGYGQTQGHQLFLEGRDLLHKVTSFECRGKYLPHIPPPSGWKEIRMVFKGGSYRTEEKFFNSQTGWKTCARVFDGRTYQSHTKSDFENVMSTGKSPPESFRHQVPSPFDLAYGWTIQPFSQLKADPKLWGTAQQMMDVAEETILGIPCLKVNIQRKDDGVTISKWLSYEHQGMPVRTLVVDSSGTVLKRVDMPEVMSINVEGESLLIPLHVVGWMTYPYELKIDRDSVRVNQPIPDSEFEISTANVEEIYDRDTGIWTNLVTGRLFDRDMNQIGLVPSSVPMQPVAQVPKTSVRSWLIVLNTLVAISLGLFLLGRVDNHLSENGPTG